MNVESVRSFESESIGSSRERTGGKESGFSDLMASVLGADSDKRAADRDPSEARDEKAPRGNVLLGSSPTPRKPVRDEKDRTEEMSGEQPVVASEPVRKDAATAATVANAARKDEPVEDESLLVDPGAPIDSLVASLAVPVFEGIATVQTGSEIDSVEIAVEEVDSGAAVEDAVFEGMSGGPAAEGEADVAEATNGRSVIADPGAREGFLAALEGARAKENEVVAAVEGKEAPKGEANRGIEEAPRIERSAALGTRVPAVVDEGKRGELDVAALRPSEAPVEGARSQTDLGSDDFSRESREGRGETQPPDLTPVERAVGDSSAAPTTASVDGASKGVVETPLRTEEPNAQVRLDNLTPTASPTPTRAPELPPMFQSGRALPTPAPEAIAIQADWLATRGGGTARLVLNPPELGEIAIRVTVRQQSVEIVMVAQTALAHSMAEDQGDRLSQAFAHRDLRLDQFEVRRGDPTDSSGTGQFGSSDAGTREREGAEDERGVDRGGDLAPGGRRRGAGSEAASPPPRTVSNGRAAGIDLRI